MLYNVIQEVILMSMVAIRLTNKEKELMEQFAKFEGKTLSAYLKELFYEKLEDFEDIKEIEEYEKSHEYNEPGIPFEQAMKEIGL
ncbi:hypothetical protein M9Y10_004558 [Tritrichomonas musculus]|uniref:Toxin-antitoxin system, antitoxin component, ribbon-helix-helix domain protein n=1 Tax=Tritrichomonas musculus TaxID=1915356 RepID=A0ABR2GND3_9EUKA